MTKENANWQNTHVDQSQQLVTTLLIKNEQCGLDFAKTLAENESEGHNYSGRHRRYWVRRRVLVLMLAGLVSLSVIAVLLFTSLHICRPNWYFPNQELESQNLGKRNILYPRLEYMFGKKKSPASAPKTTAAKSGIITLKKLGNDGLKMATESIANLKVKQAEKLKEATQKRLEILDHEMAVNGQKSISSDLWGANEKIEPSGQKIMVLTASDGKGPNSHINDILHLAESNRREYCALHNYQYMFINLSRFDLKHVHAVWGKLNAIKAAFEEAPNVEWVWWMDLDMIIMNPEIDLARHILNPTVLKKRVSYGRPLKEPSTGKYSGLFTGYNPDEPLPKRTGNHDDFGLLNNEDEYSSFYTDVSKLDLLISQDYWGLNAGSFLIRRSQFIDLLLDYWSDPAFIDQKYTFREQDTLSHLITTHSYIRKRVGVIPQRLLNSYVSSKWWAGYEKGDLAIHFAGCWVKKNCNELWQRHWVRRSRVSLKAV